MATPEKNNVLDRINTDLYPFGIEYLADVPEHIPTIAQWFYEEWLRDSEGWSYEQTEHSVRTNDCFKNRMNVTLIALEKETRKPIGVIQLLDTIRLSGWEKETPWLDGLFIVADRRHSGIAYALASRMLNLAEQMGFKKIYAASAQMVPSLRNHHFGKAGEARYGNEAITIYRKNLTPIEGLQDEF